MNNTSKRTGFTLVEVLVVVVIIAILMGLISNAIFSALVTAKEFAIFTEATALGQSMQSFKNHYQSGEPPADLRFFYDDGTTPNLTLTKFVARTFPRYDVTRLKADLDAEQIAYASFDPGYSLVFWLVGFSGDPSNPFRGHHQRMQGQDLTKAFFDFDAERIVDGHYFPTLPAYFADDDDDGVWDPGSAFANGAWGTPGEAYDEKLAYLYFDFKSYVLIFRGFAPYQKVEDGQHYNHDTHQIVNAGLDRKIGIGGPPRAVDVDLTDTDLGTPTNGPYIGDDADNITNFSGGTMGDFTDK